MDQDIVAIAGDQRVMAVAAEHGVFAGAPEYRVVAAAGQHYIVAGPLEPYEVVADAGGDHHVVVPFHPQGGVTGHILDDDVQFGGGLYNAVVGREVVDIGLGIDPVGTVGDLYGDLIVVVRWSIVAASGTVVVIVAVLVVPTPSAGMVVFIAVLVVSMPHARMIVVVRTVAIPVVLGIIRVEKVIQYEISDRGIDVTRQQGAQLDLSEIVCRHLKFLLCLEIEIPLGFLRVPLRTKFF